MKFKISFSVNQLNQQPCLTPEPILLTEQSGYLSSLETTGTKNDICHWKIQDAKGELTNLTVFQNNKHIMKKSNIKILFNLVLIFY